MIRHYKYIFLWMVFLPGVLFAQNSPYPEEDAYEADSLYAVRNAFKIDPVQIIFGDFQVYFEKMITSHWSVEVGFGPTRRNFSASWFDYELDNFGENVDVKTRYAASAAVRYYFWDVEELAGPYLSLAFSHKRFDKAYAVVDTSGALSGDVFDDSRQYTSAMVFAGYQALGRSGNIFADFYVGLGIRQRTFDIVRSTDIYDPMAYSIDRENSFAPGVQVGVKIGFGF